MQRKRLEEMNLLDDFLFNAVMTFPGIGGCGLLRRGLLVAGMRVFAGRGLMFWLRRS